MQHAGKKTTRFIVIHNTNYLYSHLPKAKKNRWSERAPEMPTTTPADAVDLPGDEPTVPNSCIKTGYGPWWTRRPKGRLPPNAMQNRHRQKTGLARRARRRNLAGHQNGRGRQQRARADPRSPHPARRRKSSVRAAQRRAGPTWAVSPAHKGQWEHAPGVGHGGRDGCWDASWRNRRQAKRLTAWRTARTRTRNGRTARADATTVGCAGGTVCRHADSCGAMREPYGSGSWAERHEQGSITMAHHARRDRRVGHTYAVSRRDSRDGASRMHTQHEQYCTRYMYSYARPTARPTHHGREYSSDEDGDGPGARRAWKNDADSVHRSEDGKWVSREYTGHSSGPRQDAHTAYRAERIERHGRTRPHAHVRMENARQIGGPVGVCGAVCGTQGCAASRGDRGAGPIRVAKF